MLSLRHIKANIADLPSRNEFSLLRAMGSTEVDLHLPSADEWMAPAAAWLERARVECRGPSRGRRKRPRGGA